MPGRTVNLFYKPIVIPAKAGIQYLPLISIKTIGQTSWTPASTVVKSVDISL